MSAAEPSLFYHVRITRKSVPNPVLTRLDLSEDELEQRFLGPYREGRSIVIGGITVPPDDLHRIRISHTQHASEKLLPQLRAEDARSSVVFIPGAPDDQRLADLGTEVTDDLIKTPPGAANDAGGALQQRPHVDPSTVFVVHGRNQGARDSLFSFLRTLGLKPLEWSEAVMATGKPAPYVGDILEAAFARAQAVVVLMTPDDEARLREPFRAAGDPPHETELTPQARPNVLFEAGMAMGRDPDRTVLIELGQVRPFSDIGGRHVVRLNNTTQRRQELAQRLQAAGCPVNLTGTDWHDAGDFTLDQGD